MRMRLTGTKLFFINLSGTLYTAMVSCSFLIEYMYSTTISIQTITGIAVLNLYCTCPALYGDCFWPTVYASFILIEVLANLLLFHYYNKRNQVNIFCITITVRIIFTTVFNGRFNSGRQRAVRC